MGFLLGVAATLIALIVGAALQRAGERSRWLRETRLRAYVEFSDGARAASEAIHGYYGFIKNNPKKAIPPEDVEPRRDALNAASAALEPLTHRVNIVGSRKMSALASEMWALALNHPLDWWDGKVIDRDDAPWDEGLTIDRVEDWIDAARFDLDVDRAKNVRRWAGVVLGAYRRRRARRHRRGASRARGDS